MIKKLNYYKISPGGNVTVLITCPLVNEPKERVRLANIILGRYPDAEQVGYVSLDGHYPRLDMMGGEFCGNASRSLAALLALNKDKRLVEKDECLWGEISVSGVDRNLKFKVSKSGDRFDSWVEMPIQSDDECVKQIKSGLSIVYLDGITHILLDQCIFPFPSCNYKEAAEGIRMDMGLDSEEAVGCIWYSREKEKWQIRPVVWVRGTNSTYYETACGSGTTALGLYLAKEGRKNIRCEIGQPSGQTISAEVQYNTVLHKYKSAWIGGEVSIISFGELLINQERKGAENENDNDFKA